MTQPRRAMTSALLAVASLCLALGTTGRTAPQADTSSAYEAVLERAVKAAAGPGAAAIVVKDGKTLFRQAHGLANLELGVPLKPETVFRLGSLTKQFTSAAIMRLIERGNQQQWW